MLLLAPAAKPLVQLGDIHKWGDSLLLPVVWVVKCEGCTHLCETLFKFIIAVKHFQTGHWIEIWQLQCIIACGKQIYTRSTSRFGPLLTILTVCSLSRCVYVCVDASAAGEILGQCYGVHGHTGERLLQHKNKNCKMKEWKPGYIKKKKKCADDRMKVRAFSSARRRQNYLGDIRKVIIDGLSLHMTVCFMLASSTSRPFYSPHVLTVL